jgi:hypothetical protein
MSNTKIINVYSNKNIINREVEIIIANQTIKNSSYLSDLNLDSINKSITDLNYIITQKNGIITWGVEQFMVDSDSERSLCKDENNTELADIPNNIMINLLTEIKSFKEQYQNAVNLKRIVGQGFNAIKVNSINYKRYPNSDFHFAITINDIFITLVLEPNDFNLTENIYLSQLNINF